MLVGCCAIGDVERTGAMAKFTTCAVCVILISCGAAEIEPLMVRGGRDVKLQPKDARPVRHTWLLRNRSDREIVVQGVATSCRCADAVVEPGRIAPGQAARLSVEITFQTQRVSTHIVWVYPDGLDPIRFTVTILVPDVPRLEVEPREANFGVFEYHHRLGASTTLRVFGLDATETVGVEDLPSWIEIRRQSRDGGCEVLELSLKDPVPVGFARTSFSLKTQKDGRPWRSASVPCAMVCHSPVVFVSRPTQFGPDGRAVVRARSDVAISFEWSGAGAVHAHSRVAGGGEYELTLVSSGPEPCGVVLVRLRGETQDSLEVARIPIAGFASMDQK